MRTFIVFLAFLIFLHSDFVYAVSLDDEEDQQDIEDYLKQAKESADKEEFSTAEDFLKKARKLGVNKTQLKESENYINRKKQERDERIAESRETESSSQPSSSSSSSERWANVYVLVKSGGFFSLELDSYTVTLKQTNELNGERWGLHKDEKTGGSGLLDSRINFYAPYGVYEIEFAGYLKNFKKAYAKGWSNLRIDSKIMQITLYGDGNRPPEILRR